MVYIKINETGWADTNIIFDNDVDCSKLIRLLGNCKFDKDSLLEVIHDLVNENFIYIENDYQNIINCLNYMKNVEINFSNHLELYNVPHKSGCLDEIEQNLEKLLREIKSMRKDS